MTHSNPLLQKYEELYGKKEKPKFIKAENAKVEIKGNSSGVICAKNPPSLTTYDLDDLKTSFQQVAEQLQNDEAEVVSMNMEFGDHMNKITFEVMVYEP